MVGDPPERTSGSFRVFMRKGATYGKDSVWSVAPKMSQDDDLCKTPAFSCNAISYSHVCLPVWIVLLFSNWVLASLFDIFIVVLRGSYCDIQLFAMLAQNQICNFHVALHVSVGIYSSNIIFLFSAWF